MALTVTHGFVSGIADDAKAAAAGEVLPSHWNATHSITGTVDSSIGARKVLTANAVYFISITGSDSNDGLTSGTAWATLTHAMSVISSTLDLAEFKVTVHVGAGLFAGLALFDCIGGRGVEFIGAGSASTTIIDGPNDAIANFGECIDYPFGINNSRFFFNKMTFQNAGIGNCEVCTMYQVGQVVLGNEVTFTAAQDIVFDLTNMNGKSSFNTPVGGPAICDVLGSGSLVVWPATFIGGNASIESVFLCEGAFGAFMSLSGGNTISSNFTVTGPFIKAINSNTINVGTQSAAFKSAGAGSVTGKRFDVNTSGAIYSFGGPNTMGANYFPGNSPGTVDDDVSQYDGLFGSEYPQLFSALPASPFASEEFTISDGKAANCADGTCTTFGTHVTAGGGALNLKIRWNGANWTLIGT